MYLEMYMVYCIIYSWVYMIIHDYYEQFVIGPLGSKQKLRKKFPCPEREITKGVHHFGIIMLLRMMVSTKQIRFYNYISFYKPT